MALRAVVLDLFDTLVDLRVEDLELLEVDGVRLPASVRQLHAAVAEHADTPFDVFARTSLRIDTEMRLTRFAQHREVPTLERFTRLLEVLGVTAPALAERLTTLHMEAIRAVVRTPGHHAALLGALAGRVRLGLCSNFSHAPTALRILDEAALRPHLSAVAISETVGMRKPAPEPFLAVLDALGVAPAEALHVGDSLGDDVAGAAACGLRSAWLTRRVRRPEARLARHQGPAPDFVIADLDELPGLLKRLATA